MNKVIVRAPVRADLAGGTLDLWPLYLFHPGSRTVNVAISFYAESEVSETGGTGIEINLTDQQYSQRYGTMQDLSADPKAALVYRALEHFHLDGISITTRTDAPRGSGLGGSSALTITLVRALAEIAGQPIEGEELLFVVRDLETRLLGVPAGIQDYYPPVFGGVTSLHLVPGKPLRRAIPISIPELGSHMVLHYTGVAHFSGTNNWELYKRQVEGKKKVQRGLANIAATSIEMERALEKSDFEAAGKALAQEWRYRKALIDGISTPEIEAAIDAALGSGAWGGKVCGAGGGGCVVFLVPADRRESVVRALADVPGRVLDAVPVAHGLTVLRGEEAQSAIAAARSKAVPQRNEGGLEELFLHGGKGNYALFVLAEALVTQTEPKSGTHQTVLRSYLAPIGPSDGEVLWKSARHVDTGALDLRTVPDPERILDMTTVPESLLQAVAGSQDSFRQFLEDSERLRVYQNPAFNVFSTPGETREEFAARCLELANRSLEDEAERLESTFRRRMDQLKQRSDREQRESEAAAEETGETEIQQVNVAWGQALYNITSGRGTAVTEPPQSMREFDYLENIAQIQKAWERELQGRREELHAQAREVVEISVIPSAKNIEISKYVILWQ